MVSSFNYYTKPLFAFGDSSSYVNDVVSTKISNTPAFCGYYVNQDTLDTKITDCSLCGIQCKYFDITPWFHLFVLAMVAMVVTCPVIILILRKLKQYGGTYNNMGNQLRKLSFFRFPGWSGDMRCKDSGRWLTRTPGTQLIKAPQPEMFETEATPYLLAHGYINGRIPRASASWKTPHGWEIHHKCVNVPY